MEEYNEMINIVLHGLGQNPSSWVNVSDCAKGIELHIPDLFKIVSGAINYDALYHALEEYCDNQEGKINLAGLSMGGVLALDYASTHPDKVDSLILMAIPYDIPKDVIAKQDEMFAQMPEEAFAGLGLPKRDFISLVRTMSEVDIPRKVENIKCKCLMICGENDTANIEGVKTIHSIITNSSLTIIKGSGHEINKDNPEDLAGEIVNFWK